MVVHIVPGFLAIATLVMGPIPMADVAPITITVHRTIVFLTRVNLASKKEGVKRRYHTLEREREGEREGRLN